MAHTAVGSEFPFIRKISGDELIGMSDVSEVALGTRSGMFRGALPGPVVFAGITQRTLTLWQHVPTSYCTGAASGLGSRDSIDHIGIPTLGMVDERLEGGALNEALGGATRD